VRRGEVKTLVKKFVRSIEEFAGKQSGKCNKNRKLHANTRRKIKKVQVTCDISRNASKFTKTRTDTAESQSWGRSQSLSISVCVRLFPKYPWLRYVRSKTQIRNRKSQRKTQTKKVVAVKKCAKI